MQSPFQIFRKHQKILMVVLIGLAMFAFILLDSVSQMASLPPYLVVVIAAVFVGGAFTIVGMQGGKGKQTEYGLTGALVGAALGIAFIFFSRPKPVVETSVRNLNDKQLREEVDRRRIAVQFMAKAFESAVPQPKPPSDPDFAMMMRLAQQNPRLRNMLPQIKQYEDSIRRWATLQYQATFPLQTTSRSPNEGVSERDVVLKMLLLAEAKELGISVNNDAVNAYINHVTNNQMTKDIFKNIVYDLKVKKSQLYEILREEIAAQIVLRLERPAKMRIVPPGAYWEQYRKLNVRQKLEFVPVKVKPFESQVAAPSEQELRKFFDKYKEKTPTGIPTPDPAFGYPERVQIAYVKANYLNVEKDVLQKLDKEYLSLDEIQLALKDIDKSVADARAKIKKEKPLKELAEKQLIDAQQKYLRKLLVSAKTEIDKAVADVEQQIKAGKIKKADQPQRFIEAQQKLLRFDYEIVKHYETNKSTNTEFQNPDWKAPHPGDKSKPDPFAKSKAGENASDSKKSANGGPKTAPPPPSPVNGKTKTTIPKPKPEPGKSGAMRVPRGITVANVVGAIVSPVSFTSLLMQDKKAASKQPNPESKTKKSGAKVNVDAKKKADAIPMLPPPPALPEDPPPPPFKKLDDTLRDSIRDDLLKAKVRDEIRRRMQVIALFMERYHLEFEDWRAGSDKEKFSAKAVSDALRKKAEEVGLEYVVTKQFGKLEFAKSSNRFPMNNANEIFNLAGGRFGQRPGSPLRDVLFPTGSTNKSKEKALYRVIRAQVTGGLPSATEKVFVLWKTIHEEPTVPKFEDKGVRDRVLKAWKQVQARPLAKKRADELAEIVKRKKKRMDEILTGETITGKKAGEFLRPERTRMSFTWLTTEPNLIDSSVPPLWIQSREMIIASTVIPGIEKAGDDFREYIFDVLKDGEIGVVANADQSIYYVVRVLDRHPTTPEGWKFHMQKLVDGQPVSEVVNAYVPLNSLGNPVNRAIISETMERLFTKYNVQWKREPDSPGS